MHTDPTTPPESPATQAPTTATTTTTVSTGPYDVPPTYGDDPALDTLWDACEAGDPAACDQLYEQAPAGSGYAAFGGDCAGRQPGGEYWCVDVEGTGSPAFEDLDTHPLLTADVGLPGPGCRLEEFGYDRSTITAHWTSAVSCLGARWEETLSWVDIPYRDPGLVIVEHASDATSPCGSSFDSYAAFYCAANETIYLPMDTMQVDERWPMEPYLETVAHEFGHHVQQLSGIMSAEWENRIALGPDSAGGQLSARRTELQATCFGGMWLGSQNSEGVLFVGDMGFDYYLDWWEFYGDPVHGNESAIENWLSAGYFNNRTPHCNTFAASAHEVDY